MYRNQEDAPQRDVDGHNTDDMPGVDDEWSPSPTHIAAADADNVVPETTQQLIKATAASSSEPWLPEQVQLDVDVVEGSPPLPSRSVIDESLVPLPPADDDELSSWKRKLCEALKRGNYGDAMSLISETTPERIAALNLPIEEERGRTALHIAIDERLDLTLIEKLVERMTMEGMLVEDSDSGRPLECAVSARNLAVVKLLVEKFPQLPNYGVERKIFPVHYAGALGLRDITLYLHKATQPKHQFYGLDESTGYDMISHAVSLGWYDFALYLLKKYPNVKWGTQTPLEYLASEPSAFPSGMRLSMWRSFIYSCIIVDSTKVIERFEREEMAGICTPSPNNLHYEKWSASRFLRVILAKLHKVWKMAVKPIGDIREKKTKHVLALEIVKEVCWRMKDTQNSSVEGKMVEAAKNGIPEVVRILAETFPRSVSLLDAEQNYSTLQLAAVYRHEEVFKILLHHSPGYPTGLLVRTDKEGNNILHLVACKPRQDQLEVSSQVILQMQNEFRWYKEVEKLLLPVQRNLTNDKGKTSLQIFKEEHKDLTEYESQWMLGMANSCIVAGSLIATVVFATAITVPGGNNGDTGLPMFSNDAAFKVFAVTDVLALAFSVTTVLIFLSIFTARYSVNDHLYRLPQRLIFGLVSLLFSVMFMMVAFGAIVYLVFREENDWIIYPVVALACLPIISFAYLQGPPLMNMIRSTYGSKSFKEEIKNDKKPPAPSRNLS